MTPGPTPAHAAPPRGADDPIALVIGKDPDWTAAASAARGADYLLFYTLEGSRTVGTVVPDVGTIIDVAGQSGAIQEVAWQWTEAFVTHMRVHVRGLSTETMDAARRMLFLRLFFPIASAHARAEAVKTALPPGVTLHVMGVSALERIALCPEDVPLSTERDIPNLFTWTARALWAELAWDVSRFWTRIGGARLWQTQKAFWARPLRESGRDAVVLTLGEERLWKLLVAVRALANRLRGRLPVETASYVPTDAELARRARKRGTEGRNTSVESSRAAGAEDLPVLRGLLRQGASERRRLRDLARDLRAGQSLTPTGPTVLTLVAVPQHVKLLESALASLRSRGWRCIAGMFFDTQDLADAVQPLTDGSIQFASFMRLGDSIPTLVRWWSMRRHIRHSVVDWARSAGLGEYATTIDHQFETQYRDMQRGMQTHRTLLGALGPDAVLTVSEVQPLVEAAVPVSRRRGIPTVNVQHGAIKSSPLNTDYGFDAFCVWGEGYAETLVSCGTDPARIRVTGSPFMDGPARAGLSTSSLGRTDTSHTTAGQSGFNILFAAGYAWDMTPDTVLHSTLAMVLGFAERDPTCHVVVKLHPVGSGMEYGYETALAQHPGADVAVTRGDDLYNLIQKCDCVATYGSTVALEAASFRKPTILLRPGSLRDLPRDSPLLVEGVALLATDDDEFAECVERLRAGAAISEESFAEFDRRHAYKRDGRAGERIADVCEDLAHASTKHPVRPAP